MGFEEDYPKISQIVSKAAWGMYPRGIWYHTREDIVQEAMLRAFKSYHTFTQETNLNAWLYKIVHNVGVNLYIRSARHPEDLCDMDEDAGEEDLTNLASAAIHNRYEQGDRGTTFQYWDEQEGPDRIAAQDNLREALSILKHLPPRRRDIYLLREYYDLGYKEIADVLDIPEGTVMSGLYRARKAIEDILDAA